MLKKWSWDSSSNTRLNSYTLFKVQNAEEVILRLLVKHPVKQIYIISLSGSKQEIYKQF